MPAADPVAKAAAMLGFEYQRLLRAAGAEALADAVQKASDILMCIGIHGVAETVARQQRALGREPRA